MQKENELMNAEGKGKRTGSHALLIGLPEEQEPSHKWEE